MTKMVAYKSNGMVLERFRTLEKRRVHFNVRSLLWGFFGIIGHSFFRKSPPHKNIDGLRLLNLGCGDRRIEGWVNADFYRLHNILWKRHNLPDWLIDITKPLRCDDNFWDGVLVEHVIEHILYIQNFELLTEIFRIIKPNAILRVIVPDLDRYLDWENLREIELKMARYGSLAEAVSNITQNHAHKSVWNEALMSEVLNEIGFVDIKRKSFRVSASERMAVDAEGHRWESLYMEARKPQGNNKLKRLVM